jgi:hypothetical protein
MTLVKPKVKACLEKGKYTANDYDYELSLRCGEIVDLETRLRAERGRQMTGLTSVKLIIICN